MGNKQSIPVPKPVSNEKSTKIYILKLQNGKYYIGKTLRKMGIRYAEHQSGRGSVWTKTYPPISIEEVYYNCDAYDEDKHLKICMAKYGINNCRGGSYTQLHLSESTINFLQNEINMSSDLCIFCGKSGHFIRDCPGNKSSKRPNQPLKVDKIVHNQPEHLSTAPSKIVCYKCHQPGHISTHCMTPSKIVCYKCNQTGHISTHCTTPYKTICYKCSQPGHISTQCPNVI